METGALDAGAAYAGQRVPRASMFAERSTTRIHADAEKKVRAGLLMAAIARKQEMKVTEEDIESGLQSSWRKQTGKNVAKLKAEYREKQKRDILIGMILEDQASSTFVERQVEDHRGRGPPRSRRKSPRAAAGEAPTAAESIAKSGRGRREEAPRPEEGREGFGVVQRSARILRRSCVKGLAALARCPKLSPARL